MKRTALASTLFAAFLLTTSSAVFAQGYYGAPPPQGGYAWQVPPREYSEYQQLGFRDGMVGAQRDFQNHRPFTPENRSEYRHPHVPRNVYYDYRQAFREGYHREVVNMGYGRR